MKKIYKKLTHFFDHICSSDIRLYITIVSLYLIGATFAPERKFFFILSFGFVGALYFLFRKWSLALVLGYFVQHMFPVGQTYKFLLVGRQDLSMLFYTQRYQDGRSAFLVISPEYLIGLILIVMVVRHFVTMIQRKKVIPIEFVVFGLYICLRVFSSVFSQAIPIYSVLRSFEILSLIAFGLICIFYTNRERWRFIQTSFILMILYQGVIVGLQWVKQSSLGIMIEQTKFGMTPELSTDFFRVFGTYAHPNILASELLAAFFISVILFANHIRTIVVVSTICFVAIVFTQSRAALLGLGIGMLPIISYMVWSKKINIMRILNTKISSGVFLSSLILLVVTSVIFVTRLLNTFLFSFSEGAGFDVRSSLIEEAIYLIRKNPFLGVGYDVFIPVASRNHLTGVMDWFPEAVHNVYLLVAAESGLVTLVMLVFAMILLIRRVLIVRLPLPVKFGTIGYALSLGVFMMFHPIDIFGSVWTVLLMSAIYNYETSVT